MLFIMTGVRFLLNAFYVLIEMSNVGFKWRSTKVLFVFYKSFWQQRISREWKPRVKVASVGVSLVRDQRPELETLGMVWVGAEGMARKGMVKQ